MIHCKDCRFHKTTECPMYHKIETEEFIFYRNLAPDNGFCHLGKPKEEYDVRSNE